MNTSRIESPLILFVLAMLFVFVASGGTALASSFNTEGWGLPTAPLSAMNLGAAGSGFATCDTNCVNFFNPAGNAGGSRTRLYQVLNLHNAGSWDGHESDWVTQFNYGGTAWFVPLQDITLGLYLLPISDASLFSYESGIDPTFVDTSDVEDGAYYRSLNRSGGLYRAAFSLSWRVDPRLYVGATIDYIGGSTTSIWTLNYGQAPPPYDAQVIREEELQGWQPRFGIVGKPFHWMQCGLSWAPAVTLQDRVHIRNYSTETIENISDEEAYFPSELTGGIQILHGLTRIKADALVRNTHTTDEDAPDSYQYAFAVGYSHQGINLRSNPWWKRLTYHTGLAWQETARSHFTTPLQEITLTGGIGWQPLESNSFFETGLQLFNRGNLDDHGRQEVGLRIYLSVALKEKWFQRRVEKGLP